MRAAPPKCKRNTDIFLCEVFILLVHPCTCENTLPIMDLNWPLAMCDLHAIIDTNLDSAWLSQISVHAVNIPHIFAQRACMPSAFADAYARTRAFSWRRNLRACVYTHLVSLFPIRLISITRNVTIVLYILSCSCIYSVFHVRSCVHVYMYNWFVHLLFMQYTT